MATHGSIGEFDDAQEHWKVPYHRYQYRDSIFILDLIVNENLSLHLQQN